MPLSKLKPSEIWNQFSFINAIPRASKKEEKLIQALEKFANDLKLEYKKDKIGNLIIKKPASKGMESKPTLILQSHVDMVHQKNEATQFDFERQGIEMYIEGDLVKAKGTTLGADNGIGVAAMLAILASNEIAHPPLEALFTVDEEAGMGGAEHLEANLLSGKIILNLDTEDDDELVIGCAGGLNTQIKGEYKLKKIKKKGAIYLIKISGLKGGHSGCEINLPRANANKLMSRILYEISDLLNLVEFQGGGLFNAIPREAFAKVYVRKEDQETFEFKLPILLEEIQKEWLDKEDFLKISFEKTLEMPKAVMKRKKQDKLLKAICSVHNGTLTMSGTIKGLVETSSNLAKISILDGKINMDSLQRSSIESAKWNMAKIFSIPFEAISLKVLHFNFYPGWKPDNKSNLLQIMANTYKDLFKSEPKISATHGGLECGFFKRHISGCQIVSFGPTIKNPHSPDECVNISSVNKFWVYLLEVLKNIK